MGVAGEDSGHFGLPKSLCVWWSEEAEGVLQRLERWAAYARGYSRLRSARLSAGRLTMRDEPEARWAERPQLERSRLHCRASLGYSSNGNLDSRCLEALGMDHSIYFKTVGELRSERQAAARGGPASPTIDCGDFLASDFDQLDSGDEGDGRAIQARLAADCSPGRRPPMGEVQLCRSVIDEDVVNNNVRLMAGLGRPRRRLAAQ